MDDDALVHEPRVVPMSDVADEIRHLSDRLRAVADLGLVWSADRPYDRERYHKVRGIAAEIFALADERPGDEIERTLFSTLTHTAPLPCADAAIIDDNGKVLLIQRSDDRLWAMPGGACDIGETPAQAACREANEEAGHEVEARSLVGVYDSRLCNMRSPLQLYIFVFLCRPLAMREPSTPHEVLDVQWFDPSSLPQMSPGHDVRVRDAVRFWRRQAPAWFDR